MREVVEKSDKSYESFNGVEIAFERTFFKEVHHYVLFLALMSMLKYLAKFVFIYIL